MCAVLLACSFFLQEISFAAPQVFRPTYLLQPSAASEPADELKLPETVARIGEVYETPDSARNAERTIFLIQDAHTNASGQMNLARALDGILDHKRGIQSVFVEGGSGDSSLSFIRKYGSRAKRAAAAMPYLRRGELHGEEYLDITSDRDFSVWGVEEMRLYRRSLDLYRRIARERDGLKPYLAKIRSTLSLLKQKFLNPRLLEFDRQSALAASGETGLAQYCARLLDEAVELGLAADRWVHLNQLAGIEKRESRIDFAAASREREEAVLVLSDEDRAELAAPSGDALHPARLAGEGPAELKAYFAVLKEKLWKASAQYGSADEEFSDKWPELFRYMEYLQDVSRIDFAQVLREQKELEQVILNRLARDGDEIRLILAGRRLEVLGRLLDLELTPEEFDALRAAPAEYSVRTLTGFLNRKILEAASHYEKTLFLEDGFDAAVRRAVRFYEIAQLRDRHFLNAMFARMDSRSENQAALITGGFHTPHLKALLRARGISYVSVTPQVLHETDHARYERLLLGRSVLRAARHQEAPMGRGIWTQNLRTPANRLLGRSGAGFRILTDLGVAGTVMPESLSPVLAGSRTAVLDPQIAARELAEHGRWLAGRDVSMVYRFVQPIKPVIVKTPGTRLSPRLKDEEPLPLPEYGETPSLIRRHRGTTAPASGSRAPETDIRAVISRLENLREEL
ncbi:MAG: hypothetical protein HQL11_06735, partial [Candidatus Omnitrophica bacterium]|nr:hypothetical protein [Candidatus Omnitrophota bacterium]